MTTDSDYEIVRVLKTEQKLKSSTPPISASTAMVTATKAAPLSSTPLRYALSDGPVRSGRLKPARVHLCHTWSFSGSNAAVTSVAQNLRVSDCADWTTWAGLYDLFSIQKCVVRLHMDPVNAVTTAAGRAAKLFVIAYSNEPGTAATTALNLVLYANHMFMPVTEDRVFFTFVPKITTSSTSTGSTSLLQKGTILTSNSGYQGTILIANHAASASETFTCYTEWVVTFSQKT